MEYLYPLTAIHIGGHTELLYTIDEVHEFIRKYGQFHENHVYWTGHWENHSWISVKCYHPWIVRDDRGRVVKYDDVCVQYPMYWHYNKRQAEVRKIAEKGLPIPGTGGYRKCWKMNHTAKKNSGAGHRNRNRAKAIYEAKEYGVKNDVGNRVIPHEDWQ